jgi:glycosidase
MGKKKNVVFRVSFVFFWSFFIVFTAFSLLACDTPLGSQEKKAESNAEQGSEGQPEEQASQPEEQASQPEEQASQPEEQASQPEGDGGQEGVLPEEAAPESLPDRGAAKFRACAQPISLDPRLLQGFHCDGGIPGAINRVQVAGEFNGWNKDDPSFALQEANGVWQGSLAPGAGHHAYKFVLNDSVWCLDPTNPQEKYDNFIKNSLWVVEDCKAPALTLDRLSTPEATGRIEADITFWRADGGADFDPSTVSITMNGDAYRDALVASDGTIQIRIQGAANNRYTFRVRAADRDGKSAKELYFYAWVEEKRFDWRDGIMYFAFVDRFHDGDPNNNGPVPNIAPIANYNGGDLAGVLAKLKDNYFKQLGVNVIWLSPLYAGPRQGELGVDGRRYSGYHGYWPIEPRKIEPRFGDWSDLIAVTREAHKQGIRVLVDLASNHVHSEHPYYVSYKDQWFFPRELCVESNWTKPIECWFDAFLPDIDYRNFNAALAMTNDSVYWAQEGELDGFRVDAVKHMINLFTRNVRAALDREVTHQRHHFYLVGETFTGTWDPNDSGRIIKEYVSPIELSGQFDFPIFWEITGLLARREGGYSFQRLDGVIQAVIDQNFYGADSIMSNFLGNHDVPRFLSQAAGHIGNMFSGDRGRAWENPPPTPQDATPYRRLRAAFTLLMGLPGIPLIYYGDEIALPGETDPDNRRMMPWSGYSTEQQAVLEHVKKVANLRLRYPALRSYQRKTLYVDGERYAYLLTAGKQRIVVVMRRGGDASITFSLQGAAPDGAQIQDLLRQANLSVQGGSISIQLGEDEGTYLLLPDAP